MSNVASTAEPHRLVDVASFGGDAVAEIVEHIGDHHADHRLVFDQEDGARRSGFGEQSS